MRGLVRFGWVGQARSGEVLHVVVRSGLVGTGMVWQDFIERRCLFWFTNGEKARG